MAFTGRPAASLVMLLLSIRFELFPLVPFAVENMMTPSVVLVSEPLMVQYLTVLFSAALIYRIVDAEVPVFVLVIIRSRVLPDAFTLPSMVTRSAPFRSISGVLRLPVTVRPETVG